MEAPSKAFLLFFLLPDWLKLNHLKSRMECGFPDIFSRHICSTVPETIGVTNYAASFGAKKCSENHIWAAELILGPRNQQKTVCALYQNDILIITLVNYQKIKAVLGMLRRSIGPW